MNLPQRRLSVYTMSSSCCSATGLLQPPAAAQPHEKWLIVDTDAGVDDAIALIMAMKLEAEYNYKVKLVTTCHGNTSIDNVNVNVQKCISIVNRSDVVVSVGSETHIGDGIKIDASYFHGKDGMGDVVEEVVVIDSRITVHSNAVTSILNLCNEALINPYIDELILITLGPLTNIAYALMENQDLCLKAIDKVVVMGGSCNGRGNCTRVAEFNIAASPDSASIVFNTNWKKIVVVSWDVCVKHSLRWDVFDALIQKSVDASTAALTLSKQGYFMRSILWLPFVVNRKDSVDEDRSSNIGKRSTTGAVICDALAVAIAINDDLIISSELVHIDVELTGTHTR